MPTIASKFGRLIREHRRSRGLSQEGLADLAGVSRSYLGKVELGIAVPSLQTAEKIALGLGETLSSLVAECEKDGHAQECPSSS